MAEASCGQEWRGGFSGLLEPALARIMRDRKVL